MFSCCFATAKVVHQRCLPVHSNRSCQHKVAGCECPRASVCLSLQDLYAAGEGKLGTDEEKFITILGNRSTEHLREGEFMGACLCQCGSIFAGVL